jgi:hypothetical protein
MGSALHAIGLPDQALGKGNSRKIALKCRESREEAEALVETEAWGVKQRFDGELRLGWGRLRFGGEGRGSAGG